ncbi:MAG TPA: hypothetical protein VMV78_08670 [Thiobacillus sp.]|nr:hypothetical protein [Thiobacillus sp.]
MHRRQFVKGLGASLLLPFVPRLTAVNTNEARVVRGPRPKLKPAEPQAAVNGGYLVPPEFRDRLLALVADAEFQRGLERSIAVTMCNEIDISMTRL